MGIRLTQNDYIVLKMALEHRFVTLDLVQNYVLKHLNADYIRTRLWQLETQTPEPLIERKSDSFVRNSYYQATNFCEKMLLNDFDFQEKIKKASRKDNMEKDIEYLSYIWGYGSERKINFSEFGHNYKLQKARYILENYVAQNWQTDVIILSKNQKRRVAGEKTFQIFPDAVFELKNTGKKFAFELELTRKSPSSYKKKIKNYSKRHSLFADDQERLDGILWAYNSDDTPIMKNLKRYGTEKHFAIPFQNLQNEKFVITSVTQEQKINLLEQIGE
jgi:hypothetical protein